MQTKQVAQVAPVQPELHVHTPGDEQAPFWHVGLQTGTKQLPFVS